MGHKRFFLSTVLMLTVLVVAQGWAQENETTTIILVRHAEEDRVLQDIPLTDKGSARAKELARVLANVKIDAVFSTDTVRTRSTARPMAEAKSLTPRTYTYREYAELQPFVDSILRDYRGRTVLISGHSDDVPAMISMFRKDFGTGDNVRVMPKPVYDSLFIVFVPAGGKATVLELKYGQPTPGN
jgi:broad specificity phosphatase PhoE